MTNILEKIKIYTIEFEPLDSYSCKIAGCVFDSKNVTRLLNHFSVVHRNDPNFSSVCLHSSKCTNKNKYFTSYSGLFKHLKTYHTLFFTGCEAAVPPVVENQQVTFEDDFQQSDAFENTSVDGISFYCY